MRKTVYCQNCGQVISGSGLSFYGNVVCGEACRKQLGERVYFRDEAPEPGSVWHCPHCGASNPLADPKANLRPDCATCAKPLDPASAAPRRSGCLSLVAVALGLAAWWS